jgi:hypothetical protein
MNAFPSPGLPGILPEVSLRITSFAHAALLAMLIAFAAPALAAPAKPADSGYKGALTILYGDNHAFGIVPPEGWTVDDSSGINSKIRVVLYPIGEKWDTAPTVMYVNPLHQQAGSTMSLKQMIDKDVASFAQKAPKGKVTTRPSLKTSKSQVAEVRWFSPTGGPPLEAVAYVAEDNLVMLLVLSSRDAEGFKRHLPAFESLVASYQFVMGGVETPR